MYEPILNWESTRGKEVSINSDNNLLIGLILCFKFQYTVHVHGGTGSIYWPHGKKKNVLI